MEHALIIVPLLLLLLLAAVFDAYRHKIPNIVSLLGWILAPVLYATNFGLDGLLTSVYGLLLVLALTFPLFALRWMGAGDVKLMVSVGAFVGVGAALPLLVFIFITGALFAVGLHLYKSTLALTMQRLVAMFNISAAMRRPVYVPPGDASARVLIPYAVPIAIGTLAFLFYAQWDLPAFRL